MFRPIVHGVDPDSVGIDVEVVAWCQFADGDGCGANVLGAS